MGERLQSYTGSCMKCTTWRPICLIAMLLAQKVYDDFSLRNKDWSLICPAFTAAQITKLESIFLVLVRFSVHVSASSYAKYYFQLRVLCEREFPLSVLSKEDASYLESRTAKGEQVLQEVYKEERKWHSTGGGNVVGTSGAGRF